MKTEYLKADKIDTKLIKLSNKYLEVDRTNRSNHQNN